MVGNLEIVRKPDQFAGALEVARQWWRDDVTRLLPGEGGGATVFVVEFADGCYYCGFTEESVSVRLGSLVGNLYRSGSSSFVSEHAGVGAYVVRCVESNLGRREARQLRDLLVREAPGGGETGSSVVKAAGCCLTDAVLEEVQGGDPMPFHALPNLGALLAGRADARYK